MLNVTRMPQSTYTVTSVLTVFIKNVSSSLYNGSKKRILKTFIIGYFQVSSPFCQKSVFLEEKPGIKNSYFKKLAHANLKNPIFQKKPRIFYAAKAYSFNFSLFSGAWIPRKLMDLAEKHSKSNHYPIRIKDKTALLS